MRYPVFFYKCVYYCKIKKWYLFSFVVIAFLLVHYLTLSYEKVTFVDASSGRVMEQSVLCKFILSEKIEETLLSKLLQNNQMANETPKWRFDGAFTPSLFGVISYKCVHQSFRLNIEMFECIVESIGLPDETNILLAIAIQKWMESIVDRDGKYDEPARVFSDSNIFEANFSYLYEHDRDEYMIMIKKINNYISEKYDIASHPYPRDTCEPENGGSEITSEQQ